MELSELYLKGWALVNVISREIGDSKSKLIKLSESKLREISTKSNSKDKVTAELILNKVWIKEKKKKRIEGGSGHKKACVLFVSTFFDTIT